MALNPTEVTAKSLENFQKELQAEFRKKLVTMVVAGILAGLAAAAIAFWGYVKQLPGHAGLVPSGAVSAFDLKEGCPQGWSHYPEAWGRFLIGAVMADDIRKIPSGFAEDARGVDLKPKPFGEPGGAEASELTDRELPTHTHDFIGTPVTRGGNGGTGRVLAVGDGNSYQEYAPEGRIGPKGDGVSFTNMPPYVALHFCKKD